MSATDSNDEYIEFNLRFAIQSLPDKKIRCPSGWSVLQLKQYLQEECSSKPEVNAQRLIYAGHCLKNDQILKEIFSRNVDGISNDTNALQVVHLVCASKDQIKAAKHLPGSDGVRNRQQPSSSNTTTSTNFVPTEAPTFNNIPQDVNQAYAQAYHNYLRAYYSQNQPLGGGLQFGVGRTTGNQLTFLTGVQNAGANQQIPVGDNNGVRAEIHEHPDFLDLLYKLIRFAFLGAIVFYSSVDRIIFVVAVICLMWYVQMRRERDNRNVAQQQPQNQQAENVNRGDQPPNPQPANQNNDNNNNELPAAARPTEQRTSAWNVFWSTIVSFFSSLIPEPIQQVPNM